MNNVFFVYAYLDPRKSGTFLYGEFSFNYEPFYVGKGHGSRHLDHLRGPTGRDKNYHKHNKIKKIITEFKSIPIIQIYKERLSESESFDLEMKMISAIGRIDQKTGPLTNLSSGGEGSKGRILTPETKNKISASNKGKRLKDSNHMFGKNHSDETKNKISDSLRNLNIKGDKHPRYGRKHSKESLEKMSKAHKGVKRKEESKRKTSESLKGRIITDNCKRLISEKNSRSFIVTDPDGNEFLIFGLNRFCKENGLEPSLMSYVSSGKRKTHKGWKCKRIMDIPLDVNQLS